MIQLISDLTSEIRELENTILYLEGQILRREIAIAEIVRIKTVDDTIKTLPVEFDASKETIINLIIRLIPQFDGELITVKDVRKKLIEAYPTECHRFKNISTMLSYITKDRHLLEKVDKGYRKI